MSRSVAVIGLGALGLPVAARLLAAGHSLAVHDVRAEPMHELALRGARAAATPAEAAHEAEVIVSLVADAEQTEAIVSGPGGILETLKPGAIFAIGSTLGPEPVRKLATGIAARGGHTLDIPISGGIPAAKQGALSLMVGGEPTVLERARPVLEAFARDITHCGDVGSGQAAKLAHQLVFAVNVMALLEGLALGKAGGVAPEVMRTVLKQGLANSAVLQVWHELGPRWKGMLRRTAPGAPLPNLRKDLHWVLELAGALDLSVPVAQCASHVADSGQATGHDDPEL
jgi:2-hydroxy-3-oxopropionate reductase